MRHWYIYIVLYIIVGVFGFSPFRGNDIATFSPVEAVWLEVVDGNVCIATDDGEVGTGASVLAALEDLKKTAAATVFLDTADYLIIKSSHEIDIEQLRGVLRPSCSVCFAESMPDLKKAAAFLAVHEPSVKMKMFRAEQVPLLREEKGRLILIEKGNTVPAADCMADCCGQCANP